jgi:hypothetical protein
VALVTRAFGMVALALLASSCDPGYEPVITNAFGTDVTVSVTYSDGQIVRTVWPACRSSFVGKENAGIVSVSIERDGMVLRRLSADDIHEIIAKERTVRGYSEWSVGPNGVSLITNNSAGPCAQETRR